MFNWGFDPYQYGVPMKDIRRASVAVIWAEIPKSATQEREQKYNKDSNLIQMFSLHRIRTSFSNDADAVNWTKNTHFTEWLPVDLGLKYEYISVRSTIIYKLLCTASKPSYLQIIRPLILIFWNFDISIFKSFSRFLKGVVLVDAWGNKQ